ncbi:DUF4956 domain-containing protein [Thiorhodovibrio frisius]|uniref:DUF4956 domain-containing protein n=1 Tax=Thiorhodovibrio frisius TaxID=631362 RepID=H8Z4L2_9GAMM|nr:DUF4956 domain-containing protein [Thiorhodovibrio frisius]EIC20269.1 hypothetical protein Thi970DRAFT_03893 [Thiorhodovibrio frisius]WPL21006.1 hypothetical protein Thiofri_01113 [Thiorhodovibrio frisius]
MIIDYIDVLRDLAINFVFIVIYAFLIYYRRHHDRQMAITLVMFNMFLFTIIITMTTTEFNMASGFALFAMLSIISLRSVNISKIEVAYLFGAITLGLINGISLGDYLVLAIVNSIVILAAWVVDSPWLLKPSISIDMTLDNISIIELKDQKLIRSKIYDIYNLPVLGYTVIKYNCKKQTVQLTAELRL